MAGETRDDATGTRIVRRDRARSLERVESDICVVGSGIAGISAALEAARLGRRVLLVDSLPVLGGQAVNSIIGSFCGLFGNGEQGAQLTHGIADEILGALGREPGHLHYQRGPLTTIVYYDEVALGRWVEEAVRRTAVQVLLGATAREADVEGRRIRALRFATRYGDVEVRSNSFVDATGDATVAWLAGFSCREPEQARVFGTQMVVLENIVAERHPSRQQIAERMREKGDAYGLVRHSAVSFVIPGRPVAVLNMTHTETPLEPLAASASALEGKAQADRAVRFLQQEFPDCFGRSKVRAYGNPGVRQTRWIAGRQQLKLADVRAGTKFPDSVARTAWPIELHDKREGYVLETFPDDHVHYIPLGALIPADGDNLMAVGRCVDGDLSALSSIRVMGPCIAMGAAAAHALDLAGSGAVTQIDVAALRRRLFDNVDRPN